MSTLISLCTYNEARNISELIPQLLERVPEATVLVIDDNSPDGTGLAADELASSDSRVQVLHRPVPWAGNGHHRSLRIRSASWIHLACESGCGLQS